MIIVKGFGNEHFWTAGTDQGEEGSFFWMSTGRPVTFTNWNAGEPVNKIYFYKNDVTIPCSCSSCCTRDLFSLFCCPDKFFNFPTCQMIFKAIYFGCLPCIDARFCFVTFQSSPKILRRKNVFPFFSFVNFLFVFFKLEQFPLREWRRGTLSGIVEPWWQRIEMERQSMFVWNLFCLRSATLIIIKNPKHVQ